MFYTTNKHLGAIESEKNGRKAHKKNTSTHPLKPPKRIRQRNNRNIRKQKRSHTNRHDPSNECRKEKKHTNIYDAIT